MIRPIYLFLFCALIVSPMAFAAARNPGVLLTSEEKARENPYFLKAVKSSGETQGKTAIQYLIARIRQSQYQFIRNHELHSSQKAAAHLAWKYSRANGKIRTPEEFIEHIASKSILTGERYEVRVGSEIYPVKDILYNELSLLEELKKKDPSGEGPLIKSENN